MAYNRLRSPFWLITVNSTCLAFCISVAGPATVRKPTESEVLLTGKLLQAALNERKSLSHEGTTLRKTLKALQLNTGIALLPDRRVDTSMVVNLTTPYLTNRAIIQAVATHVGMSVSFGESYVLFGPRDSTDKVRTLTEIHRKTILDLRRKINSAAYRKLTERKNRSWPRLSQPRQLLIDEAAAMGIQLENVDSIPHDVWAEASLPSLTFSDFATLILIQFDLGFESGAEGSLRIVPVPEEVGIQNQHRVSASAKAAVAERWTARFPDLAVKWRGNSGIVFATVETHEALRKLIKSRQDSTVGAAGLKTRLFTFKAPPGTPMSAVVEKFRESGVPIRFAGATQQVITKALEQTVQFEFQDIKGVEFFPKVFESIAATVTVDDSEVILTF